MAFNLKKLWMKRENASFGNSGRLEIKARMFLALALLLGQDLVLYTLNRRNSESFTHFCTRLRFISTKKLSQNFFILRQLLLLLIFRNLLLLLQMLVKLSGTLSDDGIDDRPNYQIAKDKNAGKHQNL